MNYLTEVIVLLLLLNAIFIGYALSQDTGKEPLTGNTPANSAEEADMAENDEMTDEPMMDETSSADSSNDTMMEDDSGMLDVETEANGDVSVSPDTSGAYLAYDPTAIANSEADTIILSFSATWCPSCRALDADINENLSAIPAGVEIYKVDYDSNVALRQEYGVTTQHTMVEITPDGTELQQWSGGNTLDSLLARI
mgnify:CR=1 FL=1